LISKDIKRYKIDINRYLFIAMRYLLILSAMSKVGVFVRIRREVYEEFKRKAREKGLRISDLVERLMLAYLEGRTEESELREIKERLSRLETAVDELRVKVDISTRRVVMLERKLRERK